MMRQLASAFFIITVCLLIDYTNGQSTGGLLNSLLRSGSVLSSLSSLTFGLFKFLREGGEYQKSEATDITPEDNAVYDFIIVGGGSAGAVLAGRLSELSNETILLTEAGRTQSLIMDVPLLVNYLQFSNHINWKYRTEASRDYCLGMKNRRCNWPRGKVMGGSSVLNYMIATRGNYRDYDRWAELGNTGWSWKDVLYYFKKMENIGIPNLRSDDEMHNTEGPLAINYPKFHTPLATAFLAAGEELGFPVNDYNGKEETGFSYIQTTTKNGARVSSNRAYITPIKDRPNLYISENSLVSRVIIDEKEKRAVGVEFIKNGKKYIVRARKEVILSAGAIGSPQILMLSGIGPADHLKAMGIPVQKDAPVGKNLMDHIAYGGFVVPITKPVSILGSDILNPMNPHLADYFNNRSGPMTVPGGCEALAFINTDNPNDHESWPNMELLFQGASLAADAGARMGFGIDQRLWDKCYKKVEGKHAWNILPMIMRPRSRGEILLKNSNIETQPRIIPNYMSHPDDVRVLVAGIRAAQNISRTKAMAKFGSKLYEVKLTGCESHVYDTDDYWECAVRTLTFTIYHHCGTTKMGPEGDPTAVVNPRLQVYGIKGLRVVDAAIIPEIPTAHTNIPVMMIAENAADMIKKDWGYPTDRDREPSKRYARRNLRQG